MKALTASGPRLKSRYAARSAKGWTPERRARQAERTRRAKPSKHSTGPKTQAGKARVAMNAFRHGCRGRAWLERARRIRHAIRRCAETVLLARVLMVQRDHSGLCNSVRQMFPPPRTEGRGPVSDSGAVAGPSVLARRAEGG